MVRFATLLAVLSSAGCHALLGIDDFSTADASTDTPVPDTFTADAQLCFGSLTRVCLAAPPTGTIIIAGAFDTDTDPRCDVHAQTGGPQLCVVAGGLISIENTTAFGLRPLVFIGSGGITVNGAITVSSPRTGALGAAATATPCTNMQNGTASPSGNGGGGGAGGSFGTAGAAGGGGGGNSPGSGGTIGATLDPLVIRGGCAGGAGAGGGLEVGASGKSGGAIALLGGSQISIISAGAIYASGGGGGGSPGNRVGGGGGGSGGLVVLDAPSIQILGTVSAHGGGGGGGGEASNGDPGGDGSTSMPDVAGIGGLAEATNHGGLGGHGTANQLTALSGSPPSQNGGGGGGGGGGAGIVWLHGSLAGGTKISPPPSVH